MKVSLFITLAAICAFVVAAPMAEGRDTAPLFSFLSTSNSHTSESIADLALRAPAPVLGNLIPRGDPYDGDDEGNRK
jgi:hypothetical protein